LQDFKDQEECFGKDADHIADANPMDVSDPKQLGKEGDEEANQEQNGLINHIFAVLLENGINTSCDIRECVNL